MLFMHPVFLCVSFVSAVIYSVYLNGMKAVKFLTVYMLPMLLVVAIINPLFYHEGATILFQLNDNPITYEAVCYGISSAVMFVSVIIWFSCYNSVMTSDKFIYLFGRIIPSVSLILSMTLRFVPKFKEQIKVISNAQKCIGRDASNGNLWRKARNGIAIISILITWALENAIDTADSMKCRGYGLMRRTSFSNYRFDNRDKSFAGFMLILIIIVLLGAFSGENTIDYYPSICIKSISTASIVVYISYAALLLIPIALNIKEDVKWYHMKLKV